MRNELIILIEKFFRNQATVGEMKRLKELFSHAETQELLSDFYKENWEEASFISEKEVEERIRMKLQEQLPDRPVGVKFPLWRKGLRIAASILIPIVCIGLGYYFSENRPKQNGAPMTVHVEVGQKANIQLPDGTNVWLNSAGSLTYDPEYNNKKERVVYLKGEAYFEVEKDESRPFIVKANDVSVEALGTKFDVKAYPDDDYVLATLLEGSIRVSSQSRSEMVEPNEKLKFTRDNRQFAKSELLDADKNVSWINNHLAFEQERLEDIAKILERMYSIQIRFASENLKDIRFSGTLKNNNLENVLQLITFVSPIHYSLENDTILIVQGK
jgi:ferric-dicitrate binding protein FerR (iron transport regulator)